MARRGFFAEIQHQSRKTDRDRERTAREDFRRQVAAAQQYDRAKKAEDYAKSQLARANDSERKRLEKEARDAHVATMEAEVIKRNESLDRIYGEVDTLLVSTLALDDFVDLSTLRAVAVNPRFARVDLETPIPVPRPLPMPSEPTLALPDPPKGLAKFFGKRRYVEATLNAQLVHEQALVMWRELCRDTHTRQQLAETAHAAKERERISALSVERERYAKECTARKLEADERNAKLDELVANLGYGTADAIQEYVSIVLSNSVYPDHFQVKHDFEFDPSTAELDLRVSVPGPTEMSTTKGYKYTKSSDEITSTLLSQKDCRDRYAGAIHQVALRSFHEVFEADRRGLIKTIALEIGTYTIDPATGNLTNVPFVIAAAERESFLAFELSSVVPALTLGKLGAAVSKNPYGLVPAERSGVRRS